MASNDGELVTSWRDRKDRSKRLHAWTGDLLIPLYHQIRIHFFEVLSVTIGYNSFIEGARKSPDGDLFEALEWDIFLTTANKLKADLRESSLDDDRATELLLTPMPHYVWRAQAFERGEARFELLFDATDLRQGDWLAHVVA